MGRCWPKIFAVMVFTGGLLKSIDAMRLMKCFELNLEPATRNVNLVDEAQPVYG
jgi:hypothetical protein